MSPIRRVDVWVSRDGKLRGVLSEEFGHTAGSAEEEDM